VKQIRKRFTYANVMSTLAVFLVLGGASALAASQLGKNSVGTKQLKKNAVTTAKIKKDAVTGAKVNEATLGTVPSANLANSIPPPEATHLVGAPGEPAFENGSMNLGVSGGARLLPVGFYKDHEGIVHLQGVAKVGTGGSSGVSVFTLPAGFRPAAGSVAIFEQVKEDSAIIGGTYAASESLDLSGKVVGLKEGLVVLDGVTFRAES
jgi:hypothetical protein